MLHVADELAGESITVRVENLTAAVLFVFLIEAAADIDSVAHVDFLEAEPPAHAFFPESFITAFIGPGKYARAIRQFLLIDVSGVFTDLELHVVNIFTVASFFHQLILLQAPVIIFIKLVLCLPKSLFYH